MYNTSRNDLIDWIYVRRATALKINADIKMNDRQDYDIRQSLHLVDSSLDFTGATSQFITIDT